MEYKPMPQRYHYLKNRYLYVCLYTVSTVMSGEPRLLKKQMSLENDKEMTLDDIIEVIHNYVGEQIDTQYGSYDIARLSGVTVIDAYDKEL